MQRNGTARAESVAINGLVNQRPRALPFPVPLRMLVDVMIISDPVCVFFAALIARAAYFGFVLEVGTPLEPYVLVSLVMSLVLNPVMRIQGLYSASALADWTSSWWKLALSVVLSFLVVIALGYLLKVSADYSRGWMLTWLVLTIGSLTLSRHLGAGILRRLAASGATDRRAIVLVPPAAHEDLLKQLGTLPNLVVTGTRFVDLNDPAAVAGTVEDLISAGEKGEFDEVVIAISSDTVSTKSALLEPLSVLPVDVWLYMPHLDLQVHGVVNLEGTSLLHVKRRPEPVREWSFVVKQALDFIGAAVGLALLSPLMVVVAIAIKLDSTGPFFFQQRRNGYNQRVIKVCKFRTMTVTEDDRVVQATRGDKRVTRVGRILRATSIDELPQLFNVIKGEMSLIGPRPHAVSHNEHYSKFLNRYSHRHAVKPGITGLAQVKGFRGPTDDIELMRKRVECDLEYIQNWSLWLDIKIIARTVVAGFVHKNAV